MFKVINKDTRTLLTLNIFHTPCSSVFIVNFEHVIAGKYMHCQNPNCYSSKLSMISSVVVDKFLFEIFEKCFGN